MQRTQDQKNINQQNAHAAQQAGETSEPDEQASEPDEQTTKPTDPPTDKNAPENASGGLKCQKMNRILTGDNPTCPDKTLYCKFRPGCLIFNKHLLD